MKKSWFVAILLLLTLALANISFAATPSDASNNNANSFVFHLFQSVFDQIFFLINSQYLYDIDLKKCQYQLLSQLSPINQKNQEEKTACLDKHSAYHNPEETKKLREETSGHFSGIGAELEVKDKKVTIRAVFENSPAEKAGLKAKDIILKVRQENENEGAVINNSDEAAKKIRGLKGTPVFLTMEREGRILEFRIVRDDVKVRVIGKKKIGNVGYVYLKTFDNISASDDLEVILDSFQNQSVYRVILDLRNNLGGLLPQALEVLYYFSKERSDKMLTVKYKNSEEVHTIGNSIGSYVNPQTQEKKNPGKFDDMKVVVLINKNSASASEIVAGTLQDWGYKIVGETSLGKGVGQTMFSLIDGSALRLTTFEYLVGNSKKRVNNIGIKPDVEVKWEKQLGQTEDNFWQEYREFFDDPIKDPQLMKAIEEVNKL